MRRRKNYIEIEEVPGEARRYYRHSNGGGLVAEGASVDPSSFVHESAYVDPGAVVCPYARIGAGAWIDQEATIGEGAVVGTNARVGRAAVLGHSARLGMRVMVGDRARVGDRCRIEADERVPAGAVLGRLSQASTPVSVRTQDPASARAAASSAA